MAVISGYVERIIYRNTDNQYTVLELSCNGDEQVLVGTFPALSEGEFVEAEGYMKTHPLYGEQFVVESYEIKVPADAVSIERYLSSGAVKGIGAALAARIVRKFKEDTFRIMEEEPERLAEVKGISMRIAMEIGSQIAVKQDLRHAMMFLQGYGISQNLAVKIYNQYGPELYAVVRQNPYQMADDIPGVGFRIADEIAARVGIHSDSDFRIKSGILYTLMQSLNNGHTYLPMNELLIKTNELLGVELDSIEKHITDLIIDRKLIVKTDAQDRSAASMEETAESSFGRSIVYASKYYYMELNSARMLCDLNLQCEAAEEELLKQISRIEASEQIELEEQQKQAVVQAAQNGLLVITGGPGTGKTTTIRAIIRFFELNDMEIMLAAPTGRAAKRMTEATGYEARTIHRMLELSGGQEESSADVHFTRNEQNPLEADVIIIDEMSMVDINLMHSLLKAVPVGARLILVGDVNQLPSVGPGNVLRDIINSGIFPVVRLTKIFRQASMSDIIVNAHKINQGQHIDTRPGSKDFLFIKRDEPNAIINAVISLVRDKLPGYVKAQMYDIQVMTPMRKGALGVERLNTILQDFLNPQDGKKTEREFPQGVFRVGDKVMQIKNNYQIEWEIRSKYGIVTESGQGIFNGDIGIIRELNLFAEELTVEYDEKRMVTYPFKQADELELAYAITIHKSQGSEYPAVVIPVHSGPRMLMNRNLLYTAVTRAKSCVCIVGLPEMFQQMIDNTMQQRRYSGLDERIREIDRV